MPEKNYPKLMTITHNYHGYKWALRFFTCSFVEARLASFTDLCWAADFHFTLHSS